MQVASKQRQQAEGQLQQTQHRLDKANAGAPLLARVAAAWQEGLDEVNASLEALPADALLASSFMAYAGAFPGERRGKLKDLRVQQVNCFHALLVVEAHWAGSISLQPN